jgi:hypothetical protein
MGRRNRPARVAIAALALVAAGAAVAVAQPQGKPRPAARQLRVVLYAPWAGPADSRARYDLVRQAAERVQAVTGRAAVGQVVTKHADLVAAIRRGDADFAIVDAAVAVRAPDIRRRILSSWSRGRHWQLVGKPGGKGLRGATLAVPAADAPSNAWFLEHVVFRGQLAPRSYFGKLIGVPATADAVAAVEVGQADLALVPGPPPAGMTSVIDVGEWPELALVAGSNRDADRRGQVQRAIEETVSATSGGTWSRKLAALERTLAPARPIVARPKSHAPSLSELLGPVALPTAEPALMDSWVEPAELEP